MRISYLAAAVLGLSLFGGVGGAAAQGWSPPAESGINVIPVVASPSAQSGIPREYIDYDGPYGADTIVVNTAERRLYYIYEPGKAIRYGVGVGREGFTWSGSNRISRMAEWPGWTPPPAMRRRQPNLPAYMEGGLNNPLGARALYIGSTMYRIHGSNEPRSIGHAVSSGCIRMLNADVEHLYEQVHVGTKVVVLN